MLGLKSILLLSATAVLLAGCVDYEEEIWLESDLSGRTRLVLTLPEIVAGEKNGIVNLASEADVRRELSKAPGVRVREVKSFLEAGKVVVRADLDFDSLEDFAKLGERAGGGASGGFLGQIKIQREHGKVNFSRKLNAMTPPSESLGERLINRGLASAFLSGNHLRYILHMPTGLLKSNSPRAEKGNDSVEWRFSLAQAQNESLYMDVEFDSPLRWGRWTVGGLVFAALTLGLLKLKKIRRPV